MEALKEVISLIGEYGFPAICSAVLIVLYLADRKRESEYFTKLFNSYLDNKLPHEHNCEEDVKYDKLYETINEISMKIRLECNAARVQILMYHNGGKNLVGIPFQKMSCISESTAPGLITVSETNQNIHRGLYQSIHNNLKKNGKYYIQNMKDLIKTDSNLYTALINRSVLSYYAYPIYNIDDVIIGFIATEFITNSDISVENLDKLFRESSMKISGIMEVIDNDHNQES